MDGDSTFQLVTDSRINLIWILKADRLRYNAFIRFFNDIASSQ